MKSLRILAASIVLLGAAEHPANVQDACIAGAQHTIDAVDRVVRDGDPVDTRVLGYAAFSTLLLHDDGTHASRFLEREISAQLPDGRFPWTTGQSDVPDANAIDFAMQDWGVILLRYRSVLPTSTRQDVEQSARRAIPALIAHHVDSDYTNIALMNGTDLVELGTALGDARAIATGTERLRSVADAIASHGIHEFASPTYSAVQVSVLTVAYDSLPSGAQRDRVGGLLTSLWTDLASSTFDGRLAGAHSRDYSFVGAPDAMAIFLWQRGLASPPQDRVVDYAAASILYDLGSGSRAYVLSPHVVALAREPRRAFTRPWGDKPNQARTTFIDGNVAIGTSTSDYPAGQQKPMSADIAGIQGDISLNAVDSGDPYGIVKTLQRDGHRKANELPLHADVTQRDGLVSGTVNLDLAKSDGRAVELSLLIPSTAQISVNGQLVDMSSPGNHVLQPNDVIGISGNGASVAFAFRSFQGVQPDSVALTADSAGLKAGAVRVTATYAPVQAIASASFILAARNDDTAATQVARLVRP